ncbi:MAG: hypothetical protein AAFY98_10090, partial [Verrucomicrobiota bacterium]
MDWEIKSRSDTCQITGRAFQEDEVYFTALYLVKEGMERVDLCQEAWPAQQESKPPLSFWKSVFKPNPVDASETVDPSDA